MATRNSSERQRDSWTEAAVEYAEQFGWKIVPLHPSPDVSEEDADDRVIRLLGRSPLVDVPEGAASSPESIREWTGYPSAALAVLTGTESNLVAIEIGPAAERGLEEEQIEQVRESLPNTRRVLGPDREYHLFSLDVPESGELNLPRLTRSDGIILHGEGSLIRVPDPLKKSAVSAFRWSLGAAEEVAPFPPECLSFFGVKAGVEDFVSLRGQSVSTEGRTGQGGQDRGPDGNLSFRSGEELLDSTDEEEDRLGMRWLARGALSLLCGKTKTTGKSTLAVNVAAHLAGGRPFLERDLEPTPVVMLSDLPVSRFRSLLSRIGVDRSARERLHVLHPEDATRASWQSLLSKTCAFAKRKQAGLVVFDSLDQFVEVKGGVDSTSNEDVVHILTSETPADCAVLAVKALSGRTATDLEGALDGLGLLGRAADVVAMMDTGVTGACPTLRRLRFVSRLEAVPSHLLCEMVRGRYQKVRRESEDAFRASGDGRPAEDLAQGDGSLPAILESTSETNGREKNMQEESVASESEEPRPSIVHQELSDTK